MGAKGIGVDIFFFITILSTRLFALVTNALLTHSKHKSKEDFINIMVYYWAVTTIISLIVGIYHIFITPSLEPSELLHKVNSHVNCLVAVEGE